MEVVAKPGAQTSTKKVQLVDRLTVGITKRKRSTPQKFLGKLSFIVKLKAYNRSCYLLF